VQVLFDLESSMEICGQVIEKTKIMGSVHDWCMVMRKRCEDEESLRILY
jgi:hypothetical protein